MHVQPSDWRPPPDDVEAPLDPGGDDDEDRRLQAQHIAEFDFSLVTEGVPEGDPPPVAAPASPPSKRDASTITEPVSPHNSPLDATPIGSPPLAEVALPEAPSGAPLKPLRAAAPLPSEQLAAVAATGAAVAAKGAAVAAIVSPSQLAEERVIGTLLQLARDIRRPRAYIGYSAFICFCFSRACKACIWEGGGRIDLLQSYAPWAIERCTRICAVDGVCCCLVPDEVGEAVMMPVSDTHPLSMCSHFVAAVQMHGISHEGGPSLQGYYSSRGVAVLGTVMDGDCGIDVACQMLGLPQTPAQRAALREEISDYLLARLKTPWMQEIMGTLHEVDIADVEQILHGMADVPILAVASGGGQSKTPNRTLQRQP